ncbi:hypothetical protein SynBIOSE41_02730 [Synechococcus sp. BIOS-E4-1]|nr:hypothetical protein SynBIOSE41_02730 [Synechococcus sp. BIOS-E4-1]
MSFSKKLLEPIQVIQPTPPSAGFLLPSFRIQYGPADRCYDE